MKDTIKELFKITKQLESDYADYGRKFTIDGHLIGSIGEVTVAKAFGLTLLKSSYPNIDAIAENGLEVQIKATQRKRVSFSVKNDQQIPEHIIVIHFDEDGEWNLIYNGPGEIIYNNLGKPQSNGQAQMSLNKMTQLMASVSQEMQLSMK